MTSRCQDLFPPHPFFEGKTLGTRLCASRTIIFQRENLNYFKIVCFTQCTLFFQKVCFLSPICLLSVICRSYVTKINAVLWHTARQTFVSLGLFTLARIARLLQLWIKISELYLGVAQIIKTSLKCTFYQCHFHFLTYRSLLTFPFSLCWSLNRLKCDHREPMPLFVTANGN